MAQLKMMKGLEGAAAVAKADTKAIPTAISGNTKLVPDPFANDDHKYKEIPTIDKKYAHSCSRKGIGSLRRG